jgi:hypothetical protein
VDKWAQGRRLADLNRTGRIRWRGVGKNMAWVRVVCPPSVAAIAYTVNGCALRESAPREPIMKTSVLDMWELLLDEKVSTVVIPQPSQIGVMLTLGSQ